MVNTLPRVTRSISQNKSASPSETKLQKENPMNMSPNRLDRIFTGSSLYDHQELLCEPQGSFTREYGTNGAMKSGKQILDATGDECDTIEDGYDSYDEIFVQYLSARKPTCKIEPEAISSGPDRSSPISTERKFDRSQRLAGKSRRFLITPTLKRGIHDSSVSASFTDKPTERLPWAQRYPPSDLNELAVHKRKVTEVQAWLSNAFTMNEKKLLVLRGPAGSGKTTTVSLLSNSLDFDVLEWKNPPVSGFSTEGYTPISAQFDEFLSRSNRLHGLDLSANNPSIEEMREKIHYSRQRIVLIEEFPALIRLGSSSLTAFRLSLQRYLAASAAPINLLSRTPLVIIISETSLDSVSSQMDNLTAHKLLGVDILNHRSTTVIDFNSIAPTFMYKALELVMEKNARFSKSTRTPGRNILKKISETGDIRSAISSLEFLCVKNETFKNHLRLSTKNKRLAGCNTYITPGEEEALKSVSQREASLGLFHAVGKIIYNKREGVDSADSNSQPPQPPAHLSHYSRPQISLVSINELLNEAGTDSQTFISALHENYVPSCDGPAFLDCLNGCLDALSDSDLLCVHKRRFGTDLSYSINKATAGLDILRQDEFSYQIAARGLLFSLPSPVKRRAIIKSQKVAAYDGHKIFFPAELRLFRERAEMDDLMRWWMTRSILLLKTFNEQSIESRMNHPEDCSTNSHVGSLIVTIPDRRDLLLYQLPYTALADCPGMAACELRKLTSFLEENNQTYAGNNTLDVNPEVPRRNSIFSQSKQHTKKAKFTRLRLSTADPSDEAKLFLSDDEIEDG